MKLCDASFCKPLELTSTDHALKKESFILNRKEQMLFLWMRQKGDECR